MFWLLYRQGNNPCPQFIENRVGLKVSLDTVANGRTSTLPRIEFLFTVCPARILFSIDQWCYCGSFMSNVGERRRTFNYHDSCVLPVSYNRTTSLRETYYVLVSLGSDINGIQTSAIADSLTTMLRSVCAHVQCECECNFSTVVNEELFKIQTKFISRLHVAWNKLWWWGAVHLLLHRKQPFQLLANQILISIHRKNQQDATVQQNVLFQCFLIAQHVSGYTPPIIRSSKIVIAASGFTCVYGCRSLRWLSHRSDQQP